MRHFYFSAVTAMLAVVLATPGRLSAQAATTAQTVTCKDGTSADKGRGACSHHGGVVRMVNCKDGSTAKKGRGACSHHGGVVKRVRAAGAKSDTTSASGTASSGAASNQTKSGVTDTKTGKSTLGKGVTTTSPDQGQPVTAKGDTLSPRDSAASSKR